MMLLITSCLYAVIANKRDESTSQSIVNQLNPTLRKALLKALTNIEIDAENRKDNSDLNIFQTTTSSSRDDELLEESTSADLYNSYFTESVNFTQKSKDDNEIIHTIIFKAPKTTLSPNDQQQNDQVIIQFGAPDPVKDSDVHIETVQIARSVKTNEIDDGERDNQNVGSIDVTENVKVTTYKPNITASANTNIISDIQLTTTQPRTHNEDGENIEKVAKNDVKIYQAPLVAAFTVHQDELGLPRNVIPLVDVTDRPEDAAKPIQEFTIDTSTSSFPATTSIPLENRNNNNDRFRQQFASTTPIAFQLPSETNGPPFTLSKSLELPSTKEATFTTFALEQKRRELEEKIILLQQQKQQQEETFRRFEEESRIRLQRYEQEQQLLRQQQFYQSNFLRNTLPTTLNQLTPPPISNSVQIIPSLSFPTQQLLPVREPNEFKPKPINTFSSSQPLLLPQHITPHLATGPQLPFKSAQQFNPNNPIVSFQSQNLLNNIDPIQLNEQSRSRNRVFRQESNIGNLGLNSINTNFPPIYPISNVDSQLQNLLLQSGIVSGRSNEDLNIISKVLSLNHGIGIGSSSFYPFQSGRFVRSTSN